MVTLTDAAAEKAAYLLSAYGRPDLKLRIGVQPGGCSGLRHQLFFDDRDLDGDLTVTYETSRGDLTVVVDRASAPYLDSAVVDHHDTIDMQGFTVEMPDKHFCSCGSSWY